MTELGI